MYNVKVSEYLESTEVVYYANVITGHSKEKDSFLVERDDELIELYSYMAFGTKPLHHALPEQNGGRRSYDENKSEHLAIP